MPINLRSTAYEKEIVLNNNKYRIDWNHMYLAFGKNKPAEQMPVERLNEAVSHYTDMNINDDEAYSLKVSDVQMLVTTYAPEYTVFGVSADAYTVRPRPNG